MRPSGQISTLETLPPPSNTPLTARLTSASVNFDFDISDYFRMKTGWSRSAHSANACKCPDEPQGRYPHISWHPPAEDFVGLNETLEGIGEHSARLRTPALAAAAHGICLSKERVVSSSSLLGPPHGRIKFALAGSGLTDPITFQNAICPDVRQTMRSRAGRHRIFPANTRGRQILISR